MVEIPKEVWTWPLEIEQSYEEVHKRKTEASVMAIKEEEVPWYYDIMKFLELGTYLDSVDKWERCSIRMMTTQYVGDNSIEGPTMVYTFIAWREKKTRE